MLQVNFMPWRQEKLRKQMVHLRQRILNSLCFIGLLVFMLYIITHFLDKSQQNHQKQIHYYQQQLKLPTKISRQDPYIVQLLVQLSKIVPQGVYLIRVHWQQPQLSLKGTALSYQILNDFIAQLQHTQPIRSFQLERVTQQKYQLAPIQFLLKLYW